MELYISKLILQVLCFRTDYFFTVLVVLLALITFSSYPVITASKRGKTLLWLGSILAIIGVGMTLTGYFWKSPHGLTAHYFVTPEWLEEPDVKMERYFKTRGQRVDRFLDFNPNDFNNRYPFSGKPFSVKWEGYIYVPDDRAQLRVDSNFGVWLYVDDELISGQHQIDFGHPAAQPYLREGWSDDERWNADPDLTFRWSSGPRSELYLGVDELTDYQLVIRCRPFTYSESPLQELSVFIDDTLAATLTLQPEWKTYQVNIPAAALQHAAPGFFRVRFAYASTARPADVLAGSTDGRQLGVAFDFARLQKTAAQAAAPHTLALPSLSRGFRRMTLMARSDGKQPFLRFLWQYGAAGQEQIIPEDALFPKSFGLPDAHQARFRERMLLGVSISIKVFAAIFLGWLALTRLLPGVIVMLKSQDAPWVLLIAVLAFALRVIFILEMKTLDPNFYILPDGTDHLSYLFFARGFLRGYWPSLTHEPFFQAPLISFYFIACSMLFGESMTMIRLMTTFLTTGAIPLVFLTARRLFNRPVAYLSAIFCACNGVLIFYDTSLLLDPLVSVFNVITLWLMLKFQDRLRLGVTLWLGAIIGLTALTRANIFLFMPFFLIWVLWCAPGTLLKKIAHYALICVVILLTLLPVTIRNYFASPKRQFVLTNTNGGLTFWIGNNPSSNGIYSYSPALLEETRQRMRNEGSSYFAEVLRFVKEQPREYLQLQWTKLKLFWRGYELGNNIPYYVFRYLSRLLRLPWLNFVLIGPLGLVGMGLAITRWKRLFLVYGFVLIQVLTTLLFFALARYRLPAVPVLSIFAAYAVWTCIEHLRRKQWGTAAFILLAFILLHVALNYPAAARYYELNQGAPMPLSRLLRYWDLFYTW